VAQVARPACQIVQLGSGDDSFRESYERRIAGAPPFRVPLYMAVTILVDVS